MSEHYSLAALFITIGTQVIADLISKWIISTFDDDNNKR